MALRLILALAILMPAGSVVARQDGPRVQRGQASFYHQNFHGRRMANGDRFDARSNAAASRTLPLGTIAEVTNLRNGETAEVVIEDRGPHARNRIIDVSPRIARELGMRQQGVVPVEVRPVGRLPDNARDGQAGN